MSRGRVFAIVSAVLLVFAASAGGYRQATAGSGPRPQIKICPSTGVVTAGQLLSLRAVMENRLASHSFRTVGLVHRFGGCLHVTIPSGEDEASLAAELIEPVAVLQADSGKKGLTPGTRVELKCPGKITSCNGSSPSESVTVRGSHYPVLTAVLGPDAVMPESAHVKRVLPHSYTVTYSLTPSGSRRWCAFTRHHAGGYTSIVAGSNVLTGAQISQPICGGQTELTNLTSLSQARMLAAYLNLGAEYGSQRFLTWVPADSPLELTARVIPAGTCLTTRAPFHCDSPSQLRGAYGVQALLDYGVTGHGSTIVIMSPVMRAGEGHGPALDLRASVDRFDHTFGLPGVRLRVLSMGGGALTPGSAGAEVLMDVQIAHLFAPGAAITVMAPRLRARQLRSLRSERSFADASARVWLHSLRYAIAHHLGDVVSASLGYSETCISSDLQRAMHRILERARGEHITVVAASGDDGSLGSPCSWSGRTLPVQSLPASDPLVTSVGGTKLSVSSDGVYETDTVWKEANPWAKEETGDYRLLESATGGGTSRLFRRPSYQVGIRGLAARRGVPDVSFDAASSSAVPIVSYERGHAFVVPGAGTSAGAPAWAAIAALADQYAGRPLGFINPALYRIGRGRLSGFHDVVRGNNSVVLVSPRGRTTRIAGASARLGWDAATGWGTPDVVHLVPLLAKYAAR